MFPGGPSKCNPRLPCLLCLPPGKWVERGEWGEWGKWGKWRISINFPTKASGANGASGGFQIIVLVGARNVILTNTVRIFEGSLEAKLPTIWTVETQSREEAERREKIRRKKR